MKLGNTIIKRILTGVGAGAIAISAHLTLKELTRTDTGLTNIPDSIAIENLRAVAKNIYEPCRRHFGRPIYISSAYRSIEVNRAVGGTMNSQHLRGEALDLVPNVWGGLTNEELFCFIRDSLIFDQLIMENGWVHVSYSRVKNRRQILILK
jgi:hypothetical protein